MPGRVMRQQRRGTSYIIYDVNLRDSTFGHSCVRGLYSSNAAGLSSKPQAPIPDGFPEIAPVEDEASAEDAGDYGRMW